MPCKWHSNFSHYAYTYDGQGNVASIDNAGTPGVPDVVLTSGYAPSGNRKSLAATIGDTPDFLNRGIKGGNKGGGIKGSGTFSEYDMDAVRPS